MAKAVVGYLGPYRLLNVVHTGHSSLIWQAYDDGKQEMVAVKTILDEFLRDRETLGMLRHEYLVGSKMRHPRVMRIVRFEVDRGVPYLAMEWFAGQNLKSVIQRGIDKIPHLAPQLVEQAAEGLAYFNHHGWVHRDIKPENFLVSNDGELKLIDFALSQRSRTGLARLFARRSKVQGTRSYMSPEQIRGAAFDTRADVYSFGCTVFEMFSGHPPFTGMSSNDLLNKHLRASPPSLLVSDKNITPEFAQLVRRCLAKDPNDRPKSMEEFVRELRGMQVYKVPPQPPPATTSPEMTPPAEDSPKEDE